MTEIWNNNGEGDEKTFSEINDNITDIQQRLGKLVFKAD
jgi:hypothetical protein